MLKEQAFSELIDTYREAKKNNLTDYALIKVTSPNAGNTVAVISKIIHSFDYIGYGKDGGLYILLTSAGIRECNDVKSELIQNGIGAAAVSGENEL